MSADFDDADTPDEVLYQRFLLNARALLLQSREPAEPAPGLDMYMDLLFTETLRRCIADSREQQRLLTLQPIVLARLAGFLAAHGAPHEDPLRQVLEAVLHGYSESERLAEAGPGT